MSFYMENTDIGMSHTHFWYLHRSPRRGIWRVATSGAAFCRDGYAVVDDFGNLVEVPRV